MPTTSVPVSELSGPALDWAVAKCEGFNLEEVPARIEELVHHWESMTPPPIPHESIRPYWVDFWKGCYIGPSGGAVRIPGFSSNWSLGGPIIDRERIGTKYAGGGLWSACLDSPVRAKGQASKKYHTKGGETPLIAAMRCYVASKLGKTVDVPSELL